MREAKINALFTANDFMEVEDGAFVPEDFADLTINDTHHEGQASNIDIFAQMPHPKMTTPRKLSP